MSRKLLPTVVGALLFLIASLGAGCADGPSTTNSESSSVNGSSSEEALRNSRAAFAEVDSFRIQTATEVDGVRLYEGEIGLTGSRVLYGRLIYIGEDLPQGATTETLFISPDLYLQSADGSWYVVSPWYQGLSAEERAESLDLEEPPLDYVSLLDAVEDVEKLSNDHVEGRQLLRYSGSTRLDVLPGFSSSDTEAEVILSLDAETYLPHEVEFRGAEDGLEFRFVFEFLDFDRPLGIPDAPDDVRPYRDLQFPEAPCTGSDFMPCLGAQTELNATSEQACAGTARRLCLVPLGRVSPELVQHLVSYYREEYGLEITVLTPLAIPADSVDPLREQVDADILMRHVAAAFPNAYQDRQAVLIGLTALDLYNVDSHYRYVFGSKRTAADPKAIVSSFRMDPRFYTEPQDDTLFFSRTRKMFTKYIGLLYYELPTDGDPRSPMYDSILGPRDLDRMEEPLPNAR